MECRSASFFIVVQDCGLTLAIVTSRGPAEGTGRPLFREQLLQALEPALLNMCLD